MLQVVAGELTGPLLSSDEVNGNFIFSNKFCYFSVTSRLGVLSVQDYTKVVEIFISWK